jgi:lysophospholipase L1-like esterase
MRLAATFGRVAVLAGTLLLPALAQAADKSGSRWVASWASSPWTTKLDRPAGNSTFRNIVHISLGGNTIRIALTNEWGRTPLVVGAAHVALSAGAGKVQPGSDHALTFAGQPGVMIPSGSYILSDPIAMPVASMADLAISVYLPEQVIAVPTCHPMAIANNFILSGDATVQPELSSALTYTSNCFVKSVDVVAADDAATIVAFGDSITDGARSTLDANRRWPDVLAARLQADKRTAHLAVINQGFGGNRILYDGSGPSALARFDRDVLAQPGAKYVILLEGINDIGQMSRPDSPEERLTAQQLIFGYAQLVIRAHQHGLKVFGATITPTGGAHSNTPQGEAVRQAFNSWIRTAGVVDGVIDFDQAVRDPASPIQMLTPYVTDDHVHPSDSGYKVMGEAIDLKLFY